MLQAAIRAPEGNPAGLAFLYRRQFELCKVQRGETIALVSDLTTRREYIQAAFAAAGRIGRRRPMRLCVNAVPSWTKVGVANDRQVQRHIGSRSGPPTSSSFFTFRCSPSG